MKTKKFNHSLAFTIVVAIVILLVVFGSVLSLIGFFQFKKTLTAQYVELSYNITDVASSVVDGDKIDYYMSHSEDDESYTETQKKLDTILSKQSCTLLYVIQVDTTDYLSFLSVFNSVDASGKYTRWEKGLFRKTTNEEYAHAYKQLYEKQIDRTYIVRKTNLGNNEPHITSIIPIKDSNDNVTALLCVQTPMNKLTSGMRTYLLNVIIWIIISIVIVSVSYFIFIRNQFVRPLHRVTIEANRFANEKDSTKKITLENISKINEIDVLARSINKMEEDIDNYIEQVKTIDAEKNRISMELNVANVIQSSAVPNTFPAFPDRTDFDIFASMTPAKQVGGDFYNFFFLDDDHILLMIGDVSGKGIGAALFMMVTMILLDDRALLGGTPSEIMTFVNNRIVKKNEANLFVTVWLGIVTLSTGEIVACNAGHDDPAIYRKNGKFELLKSKHGIVVGAIEGYKFKDYKFKLNKGDKLYIYTDGIPEATNSHNQMFTLDGMINSLNNHNDGTPKEICEGIIEDANAFVDGSEQFDDMTMICFEYDDIKKSNEKEIVVPAKIERLDEVNNFILGNLDLDPKTSMQISLSVEEIFVNIQMGMVTLRLK